MCQRLQWPVTLDADLACTQSRLRRRPMGVRYLRNHGMKTMASSLLFWSVAKDLGTGSSELGVAVEA